MKMVLPSLPVFNITDLRAWEMNSFNKSMSCTAGHDVLDLEETEPEYHQQIIVDWPHWPTYVHFHAKAHGPYPFWQFGSRYIDSVWEFNASFDEPHLYEPGAEIEVWHSTPDQATKFYHPNCRMDFLGFDNLGTTACYHLMKGAFQTGSWFLYTADKQFCCVSNTDVVDKHLGIINRKFVDRMKYVGEADFNGDYYNGRCKRYLMALTWRGQDGPTLPINVWYETDLDGKPLRFGEVGRDNYWDGHLHDYDYPLIYEEFDPESFADHNLTVFPSYEFDMPQSCNETKHTCQLNRKNRENGNI